MGLFDTILVEHDCRNCGEKLTDYQTKALDPWMKEYRLGDKIVMDGLELVIGSFLMYDSCWQCGTSTKAKGYVRDGLLARAVEFDDKGKEVLIAEYTPGKR